MTMLLRFPLLAIACLAASAFAAEPPPQPWPLWDGHESIADYGKRAGLEPTKTLDLGGGVTLALVLIPAGKFTMGTPEPMPVDEESFRKRIAAGQASARDLEQALKEFRAARARDEEGGITERPAREVTIASPFYMGSCELTQGQYQAVMGRNPSAFKGVMNPVEQVLWDDAEVFCAKMGRKFSQVVRLPTEAEWEYACRAGTVTQFHSGDTEADLDDVAWYWKNSDRRTLAVGLKKPNAWGLHDMHGNVAEWCERTYGRFPGTTEKDEDQWPDRVVRGGSYFSAPMACRSASRDTCSLRDRRLTTGFRVVVEAPPRTP